MPSKGSALQRNPDGQESNQVKPSQSKFRAGRRGRPAFVKLRPGKVLPDGHRSYHIGKLRNKANFSAKNPMKVQKCPKKQTHFKANQTQFKPIKSQYSGQPNQKINSIRVNPTKSRFDLGRPGVSQRPLRLAFSRVAFQRGDAKSAEFRNPDHSGPQSVQLRVIRVSFPPNNPRHILPVAVCIPSWCLHSFHLSFRADTPQVAARHPDICLTSIASLLGGFEHHAIDWD